MQGLWISIAFPFGLFFAWLFFIGMRRQKSCPDCNEPLPRFQSPFSKTWRQWMEGGSVCQNCGCEADFGGRKVKAGTPPRPRSIFIGIGLLALAGVPAIVLLIMLLKR